MDDRFEAFGTSRYLKLGLFIVGIPLLVLVACGSPQESSRASRANSEPTTVAGLAAAVLTHLDPESVKGSGGDRNKPENWIGVDFNLEAAGAPFPLAVNVMEYTDQTGPQPSAADMCGKHPATLSCRTRTLDDGSVVTRTTTTESRTGEIDETRLWAYVFHFREDYVVAVIEEVPSRNPHYDDMTRLPLDVTVLEAIATDPLVGTHTSPELNDAGKDVKGAFDERGSA